MNGNVGARCNSSCDSPSCSNKEMELTPVFPTWTASSSIPPPLVLFSVKRKQIVEMRHLLQCIPYSACFYQGSVLFFKTSLLNLLSWTIVVIMDTNHALPLHGV